MLISWTELTHGIQFYRIIYSDLSVIFDSTQLITEIFSGSGWIKENQRDSCWQWIYWAEVSVLIEVSYDMPIIFKVVLEGHSPSDQIWRGRSPEQCGQIQTPGIIWRHFSSMIRSLSSPAQQEREITVNGMTPTILPCPQLNTSMKQAFLFSGAQTAVPVRLTWEVCSKGNFSLKFSFHKNEISH